MYQQNRHGMSPFEAANMTAQLSQQGGYTDDKIAQLPRVAGAFDDLDRAIRGLDEISQAVMERTQIVQRPATPEPAQVKEAGQIRGASSNLVITVEEAAARVRAISGRLQGLLDRLEI